MPDRGQVLFSIPDRYSLFWAAVIVGLLIVAGMAVETWRRRSDRQRRLDAEWKTLREIATEKELSDEDWRRFSAFIRRNASRHPLRAATVRQTFDQCVTQDLASLRKNEAEFESQGVFLRDMRMRLGLDYIPFGQHITSTRQLYNGQPVWITSKAESQRHDWRQMNVAEVNEAHLSVAPVDNAGLPPVHPGDEVRCRLWREEDARYIFTTHVAAVESNPPLWKLHHSDVLDRRQAREYFRIAHQQNMEVRVLENEPAADTTEPEERRVATRIRGRLTSLSGGGFAILVSQPVANHVQIEVPLQLEQETLDVVGEVVGVTPMPGGRYLLRASLANISHDAREKIAQFVFRRQQQTQTAAPKAARTG